MKSIRTLSAVLAIAFALSMTSCLKSDNNNKYVVTDSCSNLFNAVLDQQTGDMTLYSGQSLSIDWEYNSNTAVINLNGVKLPDNGSLPSLQLVDVPFKYNSRGWFEVSLRDVEPTSSTGFVSNLHFNSFNLEFVNRMLNNARWYTPCLSLRYVIDNRYTIFTLPEEALEMGSSVITDQSGAQYKPNNDENATIYYLNFDVAKKTAYVVIVGAKFAAQMPGMNMKFANIPFSVDHAGNINMAAESIVPDLITAKLSNVESIKNLKADDLQPSPNFPITNFKATLIPDYGLQISYNCTPTGKDGQPMGLYSVEFKAIYPNAQSVTTGDK